MGTVHILECVRESSCVKSFLNVTTDKVYRNREWVWGYREGEELDGFGLRPYPVTNAPAPESNLHSHAPLKPVCPVIKTLFPR